jgi:hypothetical protein
MRWGDQRRGIVEWRLGTFVSCSRPPVCMEIACSSFSALNTLPGQVELAFANVCVQICRDQPSTGASKNRSRQNKKRSERGAQQIEGGLTPD